MGERRLAALMDRHPRRVDAAVVAVWLFISIAGDVVWPEDGRNLSMLPSALIMPIALFWRRHQPVAVFALHSVVLFVMTLIDADEDVPTALLAGVYALAAWERNRRRSLIAFGTFVAIALVIVTITDRQYIDDALVVTLIMGISWLLGDAMQYRRRLRESLLERAERAEALRDSLAQQAVVEERTRIARELHDVLAHSMSLMVVQAGAARRVASTYPGQTVELIESVETIGRNSLDEMRRILGVLRAGEEIAETAPQPGLHALDALAEEFAAAGLAVNVESHGASFELPASGELTVYRIVQESLTNTLKHARASAATVRLGWSAEQLELVVEDDGTAPGKPQHGSGGSRKGIVGMRERVAAFDGTFDAGPKLSGGWRVRVTLPFKPVVESAGNPESAESTVSSDNTDDRLELRP